MQMEKLKRRIINELLKYNGDDVKEVKYIDILLEIPIEKLGDIATAYVEAECYYIDKYGDEDDYFIKLRNYKIDTKELLKELLKLPARFDNINVEERETRNGNKFYTLTIEGNGKKHKCNIFNVQNIDNIVEYIKRAYDIKVDERYKTAKYVLFRFKI